MFYIYDVDMTLAESDCAMNEDVAAVFRKAMIGKKYFFCSGSDVNKMKQQIPEDIINNAAALFPVMGGEMWQDGELVYRRKFEWPEGLRDDLENILAKSEYLERTGDHIQDRKTMICFSTVGKAADMPARKRYELWELEHGEREVFAELLSKKYPSLHFSIGGKTSIDISDYGNDKSQCLPSIRKYFGADSITFFGDRMYDGGNDYPLSEALRLESKDNISIAVKNPEDTLRELEKLILRKAV